MFEKEYLKFEVFYKKCNCYLLSHYGDKYNGKLIYALNIEENKINNFYYTPTSTGDESINLFLKKIFIKYIRNTIKFNKTFLNEISVLLNTSDKIYLNLGFDKNKGRIKLYIEGFDNIFFNYFYSNFKINKNFLNENTKIIGIDFYIKKNLFDIKFYNNVSLDNTKYNGIFNNIGTNIKIQDISKVFSLNGREKVDYELSVDKKVQNIILSNYGFMNNNINDVLLNICFVNNQISSFYFIKNI